MINPFMHKMGKSMFIVHVSICIGKSTRMKRVIITRNVFCLQFVIVVIPDHTHSLFVIVGGA